MNGYVTGSSDSTAKVWNAENGTEVLTLNGHTSLVNSVRFSPDGSRILTGGMDNLALVWDTQKGTKVLSLKGHTSAVSGVAFSPDSSHLFAWDAHGEVLAWSVEDGRSVVAIDPPARPTPGLARSPDGRLAAKLEGNFITIADLHSPVLQGDPWPFPDDSERLRYHSEQARLAITPFVETFHLGWMLRFNPLDATVHVRLAHLHIDAGQNDKAALHLTKALLINPKVSLADPEARRKGHAAAMVGDWSRAVRHFRMATLLPNASSVEWGSLLMTQLAAKDHAAARATATELLADGADPKRAIALVYGLGAVPLEPADAQRYVALTKRNLSANRNAVTLHFHGVALSRAGRHDEALRLLSGSVAAQGNGGFVDTWPFLALVQAHRGKHDDARRWLSRLEAWHKTQNFADWQQRVFLQSLADEVHRFVDAVR